MKNLFIPFDLALIAKEKGFNEPCFAHYYNKELTSVSTCKQGAGFSCEKEDSFYQKPAFNFKSFNNQFVSAPVYQQIVDWFREKHKIHIVVEFDQLRQKDIDEDIETYSFRINEVWSIGKDWSDYKYGFKHIKVQYKIESYYEALDKAIEEAFKLI